MDITVKLLRAGTLAAFAIAIESHSAFFDVHPCHNGDWKPCPPRK